MSYPPEKINQTPFSPFFLTCFPFYKGKNIYISTFDKGGIETLLSS
jgi:hypothetical protein